ncbi:phosphatase PAP2 family protein [Rhodococcus sp. NPDC059234]|uniref:phosphatase PAP2 family protein n=1 Tax=Rhodococcus sp. NPDC059234 TaxID=3346781 RepID=UPI0036707BDB
MTTRNALRWWPPVGVLAMIVLGLAVGRGSTPLDAAFLDGATEVTGSRPTWLLAFTDWWLLGPVLAAALALALWRRQWRLAAVVALCPWLVLAITQALKRLFDRRNGPYLEYPSGHTTMVVVVAGMALLVVGVRWWAVTIAAVVCALGMLGLVTNGYHFVTDTIGAALLTTALVCLAARVAGLVPARPPDDGRGEESGD